MDEQFTPQDEIPGEEPASLAEVIHAEPKPKHTEPETTAPSVEHPTIDLSRLTVNYTVIAVVFLAIGILMGRLIFGQNGSSIDAVAMRSIINDAIAQAGISGGSDTNVSAQALADDDPGVGSDTALVTIVEFSDFNCGYCQRFAGDTLPQIIAKYGDKVRFVYRDMPIIGGNVSVEAAIAAECAADQGKFWDYHNILFANPSLRTREAYVSFAGQLQLDTASFTTCLDSKEKSDEVQLDWLDGQALGINGTPTFYVNGRAIRGAIPFETFEAVIDSELAKIAETAMDVPSS